MQRKTKLFKFALGFLLSVFLFQPNDAQTIRERRDRIRSAMDADDLNSAIAELRVMRGSDPNLFAANNYDYLLGRLSEQSGDVAGSSSSYQSVVARNSLLSQYALWHLAQMARSTGDLVLERERLRQLIGIAPTSPLRDATSMRLGQSFFESGDYASTVSALRPLTESKTTSAAREALALTARAYLRSGKQQEARQVFTKLAMQTPDASRPDDFALEAVRALDAFDGGDAGGPQSKGPKLSDAEHLLRASIYQFNRDFDGARLHYLAVIDKDPRSGTAPNALYQVGRGFYLQQRYEEALKYFQRVVDQFSDSSNASDSLISIASTYSRLKRTDDAVTTYKSFIDRFPDAPNPERAYLNTIDALHEAGRYKEALDWVQQTRTRFKDQLGASLAVFAQARIHLAQGLWQSLIADTKELGELFDLGGTHVPGGTTQSEVLFLRAYALEQVGRFDDCITAYLSIPDGRNEYYGRRATQRLRALAADAKTGSLVQARAESLRDEARKAIDSGQAERARYSAQDALRLIADPGAQKEFLQILKRAYDGLLAYQLPPFKSVALGRQDVITSFPQQNSQEPTRQAIADELLFLGLYDEGAPEIAAARMASSVASEKQSPAPASHAPKEPARPSATQSDTDYTLALCFLRGGLANRAVSFAEQVWKPIPGDYVLDLAPPEIVELLYPVSYRESLLKHAPARGVDPRFVLSIARQESRFQSDAKSGAAARGLMQFISATANEVAGQLGRRDFPQDELYNPDTALLFGSQYLSTLFKQFPGQPQAVAASYNSGPENVARWIARSRSDEPDRYVAEIGFSQTKDYVFKVMTNFWVYQQLYDAQLQRLVVRS